MMESTMKSISLKLTWLALLAGALPLASAQAADELFRGLGGKPGIHQIIDRLIPIVLADKRISETFTDIDMKKLSLRLEEQFCVVSGGPCVYKGKDMAEIHDGMNVTNAQFNALVEDLQAAMQQSGIASRVQNRLLARLAPMQREVVTK